MNKHFKEHLLSIKRLRTSLGRDMEEGLCLDRNERAVVFDPSTLKEIQKGVTSALISCYPEPASLYQKLSKFLNVPEDNLYITNGITEGIRIVYETLTSPGDEVCSIDPTFPMYGIYAKIFQTEYKTIKFKDDLSLDIASLDRLITDRTAFVALPNPNLPIESYLSPPEIKKIAAQCKKHGAFLVVDEAYGFFGAQSTIPLVKALDNLIIFQTFSKAFGAAGLRIGYIISQPQNIEYLTKTRSLVESSGPSMAIAEYLLGRPDVLNNYVRETKEGRNWVRTFLGQLGLKCFGGDYTNAILIFLENKQAVTDCVEYLKKRKIYVRASFEFPLDRCLRLTLAPIGPMKTFAESFKKWLVQYNVTSARS